MLGLKLNHVSKRGHRGYIREIPRTMVRLWWYAHWTEWGDSNRQDERTRYSKVWEIAGLTWRSLYAIPSHAWPSLAGGKYASIAMEYCVNAMFTSHVDWSTRLSIFTQAPFWGHVSCHWANKYLNIWINLISKENIKNYVNQETFWI